ncbi:MAG: radical SAM/SPASM domain-containing protein, partial [Chloroflexota bacterium]
EWRQVLEKAWAAGIPHVIFTGGEATLRVDLPELIAQAEQLGMVSGLLSDGLRLVDPVYLERLLQAGLDHLMIVLQPGDAQSWQALSSALAADLSVAAHLTITPNSAAQSGALLERLAGMGVSKVSLSAIEAGLAPALQNAARQAAAQHLELVWSLPAPYSRLHPVALEAGDALMEGAGRAWLYVEPDGDVRPAQGDPRVKGNLLRDDWQTVWRG